MSHRPVFDAEQRDFRESAARFIADEVEPAYASWDAVPASVYAAAASHGFIGMAVAEEHGGLGVTDPRFRAVVIEEAMAAGAPAFALGLAVHNDVVVPALASSSFAAGLADGSVLGAFVDGGVTVEGGRASGASTLVVNGGAAGVVVVAADETLWSVDASSLNRVASAPLIGLRAGDLSDLGFEGVEATQIGEADAVARARSGLWLALAVAGVAGARHALALTLEYVADRRAFGQPIARFENTRQQLAAIEAEIAAAEALVDSLLVADVVEPARAAAAKLRATELLGRAVDQGLQLHGGYGYMTEYPISLAYADARFLRVFGSTSEDLRAVVAESIGL